MSVDVFDSPVEKRIKLKEDEEQNLLIEVKIINLTKKFEEKLEKLEERITNLKTTDVNETSQILESRLRPMVEGIEQLRSQVVELVALYNQLLTFSHALNERLKYIEKKKTSGAFDDKVKSLEDKQNNLSISFNESSKFIAELSQKLKDIEKQEGNSKKNNNLEKKYTNIEKTLKSYVDGKFVPKVDYMNNLNAILDIKAALEKLESQISSIKEEFKIDYTTAIDTMQKKLIAKRVYFWEWISQRTLVKRGGITSQTRSTDQNLEFGSAKSARWEGVEIFIVSSKID